MKACGNCINGGELGPDRKLRDWHATNPLAYRDLFDERAALVPRMTQSVIAAQREVATTGSSPVRQSVKGILRRTVQFLKRHRDLSRKPGPPPTQESPICLT